VSRLTEAIWAGDVETLDRLAPCRCCCAEHTFASCPARAWHGCRGSSATDFDEDAWAAFYERSRGMSRDEFFNTEEIPGELPE
jgi:hypothetical protein